MAVSTSWLRLGAGMVLVAGLLGLGSGCKRGSSSENGTSTITGVVNYSRLQVAYDPLTGEPESLGAAPGVLMPARGVLVRAFQCFPEYDQNGNLYRVWKLAATSVTDNVGAYSLSGVIYNGWGTFVEVDSVFQTGGARNATVQVMADPSGLSSTLPEPQRMIYAYRQDVAGNLYLDPTSSMSTTTAAHPVAVPAPAAINGDVSMNFNLQSPDQSDPWALILPNWYLQPSQTSPATLPIGSEVLGILDSIYSFSYWFGDPTPSVATGGVMDLHWYPGRTEQPRRSFVVYDPTAIPPVNGVPLAWDGARMHYFATLAGGGPAVPDGPNVDDGWDPGVLLPMLARNNLFGQGYTALYPTGAIPAAAYAANRYAALQSLSPDLAVVEGLADAMAASVLQNPWLTDTTATTGLVGRDIRVAPVPLATGDTAAASVAALGWNLVNHTNAQLNGYASIDPALEVGTPAQWALINPQNMQRFFTLAWPYTLTGSTGALQTRSDIASIYKQLARLQEPKTSNDLQDLVRFFPDLELDLFTNQVYAPTVNIPWTTNASLPQYATNWNLNPGFGANPAFVMPITLSMANAEQVLDPAILTTVGPDGTPLAPSALAADVYPNVSQGEVAYAELSLNVDWTYTLNVTVNPASALPAGATIEVAVDGAIAPPGLPSPQPQTFTFPNTTGKPYRVYLTGNPVDITNPVWHYLRIRLVCPGADPDNLPVVPITVTLS